MTRALVALTLVAVSSVSVPAAEVYWDANGPSSGGSSDFTASGTWGSSEFWNTDPDGGAGTFSTAVDFGDTAVFSAGNDVTGAYSVTVSGTQSVVGVRVEEGDITQTSGVIDVGTGEFRISGNASWSISSSNLFNQTGAVVLDGGTLKQTNPGSLGAFLNSNKSLMITANGGTISYNDGTLRTISLRCTQLRARGYSAAWAARRPRASEH